MTRQAERGLVHNAARLRLVTRFFTNDLQTVSQKGYDPASAQTQRVRGLLELLHQHRGIAATPIFGVLEGSGFSVGGLRPFSLFQRTSLASWVIEWGRQDPTVWDFADGAQPEAYLDLSEWRPSTMMREAEQVLHY